MASVGLSFLKVLENQSSDCKNLERDDNVYVLPMMKRSASAFSTKSLEMCTESLGSETGSDVSESGDEFCAISMAEREKLRALQRSMCRKTRRSDFPPPLTSISNSGGAVKVIHHREDGRLVIKALSFANFSTNFQAERTNGRLKLTLLKDCCVDFESGSVEVEEYDEADKEESDDDVMAEETAEEGGGRRSTMAGKGEFRMLTSCKKGGNGNQVFANLGSSWMAVS